MSVAFLYLQKESEISYGTEGVSFFFLDVNQEERSILNSTVVGSEPSFILD